MRLGRVITVVTGAAIVGALAYALWPKPAPVDIAEVKRADMAVTVDEDGRTRVKERYVVSSPLAGMLVRVGYKAGAEVEAGKTVLAELEPSEAALLDPRAEQEAAAKVNAAEAALAKVGPEIERAEASLGLARVEHERMVSASQGRVASKADLDRAAYSERMKAAELDAARFQEQIARFELDLARAALARTRPDGAGAAQGRLRIVAPVTGRVLRVHQESGAAVTPGQQILEVGDSTDLEVEVDVLSADAVKIALGAKVSLEHWGGERPLRAAVRRVEPSGFLKISALGVEEQRVWVIIDLLDPVKDRPSLGDGYRVEARIEVWEGKGVVCAPIGAVFRHDGAWAAYVVDGGVARLRPLKVGHQNATMAEVVEGLKEGERVVVHASDRVKEGAHVVERK